MRSTGITRKVDELGRIVLPMELRRSLNIKEDDPLEVWVDGDSIILVKHIPKCVFCGQETTEMTHNKPVCKTCRQAIATEGNKYEGDNRVGDCKTCKWSYESDPGKMPPVSCNTCLWRYEMNAEACTRCGRAGAFVAYKERRVIEHAVYGSAVPRE